MESFNHPMSRARTFLIFPNELDAEWADQFVAEHLRETESTDCTCWSGIWTNGLQVGIAWGSPVAAVFGQPVTEDNPDGDPDLMLVEETFDEEGNSDWSLLQPTTEETPL